MKRNGTMLQSSRESEKQHVMRKHEARVSLLHEQCTSRPAMQWMEEELLRLEAGEEAVRD